jgi:DNA-binding NarL/FixJ family response regulator
MSEINNIYKKNPIGISPNGSPYNAAIVDDSATSRIMLKQILLSVSFNVIAEISNGELAASRIKSRDVSPDYLFIDVEMPLMDGITLVREVKPFLPNCKIYMVTSHSQKEKVEEIAKLGITGYVKKPYDRELLIARLAGDSGRLI